MEIELLFKNNRKRKFLEVKPWNWGKGTEKTSEEIDNILAEGP